MSAMKKSLGVVDIIALAFGAMVGWGWVVLASGWVVSAGTWGAITAFLVGGLAVVMIGVTYAELTSSMPITGGEHTYTHRALGVNVSFICSWSMLFGYLSVVAFEAVALPTVVEYLIPNYNQGYLWNVAGWDVYATWAGVGMAGSILVTWLNTRGMEVSAWFQKTAVAGILIVGVLLFIGALLFNPETTNTELSPAFIGGIGGIMAVIVMVPFMFVGFDVIPQAAEEMNLTRPNIGKFLIVSLIVAVVWYIAVIWSVGVTLPLALAETSSLGTADAMETAWQGKWAGVLLVIGGVLGIMSSWNAFLIGGSRLLYAMSKAHMLPAFLGKLHPKHKTPINAILLIGGLATLAPLFGRKMLVWIVTAGGFGVVIAYTLVAVSFLVLRYREPDMVRPFKIPAGKVVGMITIILSLGLFVLYLPGMPSALSGIEWSIFLGWTILGIIFFAYESMKNPGKSKVVMAEELEELKVVNQQWLQDNPYKK
ncbi:APC family permease [uncultured Psychrobacter sp.]|uniref:APC family permease n=1 Tax=uncultured Psychrobacter sp. TaxID=259303 RepID=UPI002612B6EE|nr:APC family permease [uncultured Psychrobacter sp.]